MWSDSSHWGLGPAAQHPFLLIFHSAERSVPVTPPSGPLERLDWGLSVCEGWWRSAERGLERSWIGLQVRQTWILVLALLP